MPEPNFSYHIFLFPFNWGKKGKEAIKSHFSDLVSLQEADQLVLQDDRWQTNLYKQFTHPEDYNEYVYFYPTVRDVLYDGNESVDENRVIRHYQFAPASSGDLKYLIHIKTEKRNKVYELNIDYILLNMYKTGIGLLSYHLKNSRPNQQDWSDILAINDFGRRIYPPYFDYTGKMGFSAEGPQKTSLARSIRIAGNIGQSSIDIIEDFEIETGLSVDYTSTKPFNLKQLPNHVKLILPEGFCETLNIHPTMDDRMFVLSSVCDNEEKYTERVKGLRTEEQADEFSTKFYQFVFVDGPEGLGVANKEFKLELLKSHSYNRWIEYGTLYGLSRYSLVSYCTWDKILVDTRTIYYKIAELCLLQRSSIIKFSEEVRRIASMNENENRFSAYINDLYKNYIIFINKIYFRDITPQEQGIELYDMLRDKMRIEKEVTDLDREINELHEYALLQEERSRNTRLQLLTVLGSLFVVPSFIMSFFGMNEPILKNKAFLPTLYSVAIVSLIVSLAAVRNGTKNQGGNYKFLLGISIKTWILISFVIVAVLIVLFVFQQYEYR